MDIIMADAHGRELGYLTERREIDIDIGVKNDFEILIDTADCRTKYNAYCRWYIPGGGELGGIVTDVERQASGYVALRGKVWRGLLCQKILCPAAGENYLKVSGELHEIMAALVEKRFDHLVAVEAKPTGIIVSNYQFPRYCTMLSGLERLLRDNGCRLNIQYNGEDKKLHMGATPVVDHSDRLEYGSDGRVRFASRQYLGITHLICLGRGELSERLVRHLYVQANGEIKSTAWYTGLEERESVLDYPNADSEEELLEKGREILEKEKSYTSMDFVFDGEQMDIPLGDIVGGRDREAKIEVKKPIVQKIIRISGLSDRIECKVGD